MGSLPPETPRKRRHNGTHQLQSSVCLMPGLLRGISVCKLICFQGFRPKFYSTFARSRSGEHIHGVPAPGNVPRKTPTPMRSDNNDKPELPSGPQEPHRSTRTRTHMRTDFT